jgi:thiol-disulfide isomerase/thioredoxin
MRPCRFLLFFISTVCTCFAALFTPPCHGLELYSGVPFYDATGNKVALEDFTAASAPKPLVLFAWKDKCAMCRIMLPEVEKLQALNPDIKVIPLMIDSPSLFAARKVYALTNTKHLPIYLDTDGDFAKAAGILSTPLIIVYNKEGDAILRAKGFLNLSSSDFCAKLNSLAKETLKGEQK